MRARRVSLILLGCAWVLTADGQSNAVKSKVDAYLQQVGPILAQALMPELAKHRELGNVRKKFSFKIDAAGHPHEIQASSVPSTKLLDHLIVRIIRGLKFPPIPKDVLAEYPEIEFRTEMGPPEQ
jgi:hypothetical protein